MKHPLGAAVVAASLTAGGAQAAPVSYTLTYEDFFGARASATAMITLDDVLFDEARNISPSVPPSDFPGAGITDFMITVTGASGSDTFGLADFDSFLFVSTGPLDGSTELVGQAEFQDFNFFTGSGSVAPTGFNPIEIITGDASGNVVLTLTSFAPKDTAVIPLPASALLLASGLAALGGAGALRRRRRRQGEG